MAEDFCLSQELARIIDGHTEGASGTAGDDYGATDGGHDANPSSHAPEASGNRLDTQDSADEETCAVPRADGVSAAYESPHCQSPPGNSPRVSGPNPGGGDSLSQELAHIIDCSVSATADDGGYAADRSHDAPPNVGSAVSKGCGTGSSGPQHGGTDDLCLTQELARIIDGHTVANPASHAPVATESGRDNSSFSSTMDDCDTSTTPLILPNHHVGNTNVVFAAQDDGDAVMDDVFDLSQELAHVMEGLPEPWHSSATVGGSTLDGHARLAAANDMGRAMAATLKRPYLPTPGSNGSKRTRTLEHGPTVPALPVLSDGVAAQLDSRLPVPPVPPPTTHTE